MAFVMGLVLAMFTGGCHPEDLYYVFYDGGYDTYYDPYVYSDTYYYDPVVCDWDGYCY